MNNDKIYWSSYPIYNHQMNNNHLSVTFETGNSQSSDGWASNFEARVSFKIKDVSVLNTEFKKKLLYSDVIILVNKLKQLQSKPHITTTNIDIKNLQSELLIKMESKESIFLFLINKELTKDNVYSINLPYEQLFALTFTLNKLLDNFIPSALSLLNISHMNKHMEKLNSNLTMMETMNTYLSTMQCNLSMMLAERDSGKDLDIESKEEMVLEDNSTSDFIHDFIDNDKIDEITLESIPGNKVATNNKKANSFDELRFSNKFLSFDFDILFNWLIGIASSDKNNFYSFISECCSVSSIYNDHKELEIFLCEYIRDFVNKSIQGQIASSSNIPAFSNLEKDLNDDQIDFLLEIFVFNVMFNLYYINGFKLLKLDDPSILDDIHRSFYIWRIININFIFSIPINVLTDANFEDRILTIYTKISDGGTFNKLHNRYMDISMGAKFQIDENLFKKKSKNIKTLLLEQSSNFDISQFGGINEIYDKYNINKIESKDSQDIRVEILKQLVSKLTQSKKIINLVNETSDFAEVINFTNTNNTSEIFTSAIRVISQKQANDAVDISAIYKEIKDHKEDAVVSESRIVQEPTIKYAKSEDLEFTLAQV